MTGMSTARSNALSALQMSAGLIVLACAGWFYVLDRSSPPSHFIGLRIFVLLLAPVGLALLVSGLALKFRWPGWQILQLAPWLTVPLTLLWLRTLSRVP
jgi:hypothetical protein